MHILKYLTNRKYRMFSQKMIDVQNSIWEFEFKVAKSRQVREGIRQDRDRAIETLQNTRANISSEKDAARKAELEKQAAVLEDDAKRYEAQMRMIDSQIHGVAPTQATTENPDGNPGQQGIMDTIAGLAELREMYKQYLTTI